MGGYSSAAWTRDPADEPDYTAPTSHTMPVGQPVQLVNPPSFADGSTQDQRSQADRIAAGDSPQGSTQYNGQSGRIDVAQGIDVAAIERELRAEAASRGIDYHSSDLEGILRNTGYSNDGRQSVEQMLANARGNYAGRANNSPGSGQMDDRPIYASGQGGTGGSGQPSFRNTSPGFSDPSQRLIEDSALARYGQLQNPDPNSGQGLFEKYARELIDTLRGPVYSAGDEATIKAGALNSVMQDRDQTRAQWLEMVGQRGMNPSSGPALEGLRRIDEHYKTLETTVDSQFARDAIDQTRAQRQQVVSTAGALAGTENQRLNQALDVARIPYNLQNDAFARNMQLVSAGGSPTQLLNSALQLYGANNANNANNSAQQQQLANGLLQYLGYVFG